MFSVISKIKIHPRRSIRADLMHNIFTASITLAEHRVKSQNGIFSKLKGLFDKPSDYSAYYTSKRNTSGPHVKNPKPPIQEPNAPKSTVRKEKNKEDKKPKKPAVYANEEKPRVSQVNQPKTVDDIKKILRHKWGVKLVKDVAPPKSEAADAESDAELAKKVKPDDRVLLGLVNKTDAELENSYVKRIKGATFTMDKVSVLQTTEPDEATSMDTEYYVPPEVKSGEEANMWKKAAAKSTRRPMEKGPTPEELQVAESIFIRPEPPAPKTDEKSVNTPDPSHVTKSDQNTNRIDGSENKTDNNFLSFFSRSDETSATINIPNDSNSSKEEEYKELANLVQKPAVVEASKLPPELPEKSLQNFKLQRIQSISKSDVERIYELKNYQHIRLSDMRAGDELEMLQKELERQKNDPKFTSGKP